MASLNCPDCAASLKPVFYEGVQVNFCLQCSGMFLDKKKLNNIQQSREIDIPTSTPAAPRKSEVGRNCPACNTSMQKVKYGKFRNTIIDICKYCSGIWLDKGELEAIQADFEAVEKAIAKNRQKAAVPAFSCPKCGHPQDKGQQCVKCGIVFAKFEARSEIENEKAAVSKIVDDIYALVKGYEFNQRPSYFEGIIGFETTNEYFISLIGTTYQWSAQEVRKGITSDIMRNIFSFMYPYRLEVYDHNNRKLFTFKERVRFFFARTEIYDINNKLIGYVQRRFSWLNRRVTINFANGGTLAELSTSLTNPYSFTLTKNNRKIGAVTKKWSGYAKEAFTDADNFSIRFPENIKVNYKVLLLGAAYMIDKTYFEDNSAGGKQRTWGQILGIPFLDSPLGYAIALFITVAVLWFVKK